MTLTEFAAIAHTHIDQFIVDTQVENQTDAKNFPLERDAMDWWAEVFAHALMHEANDLLAQNKPEEAQALMTRYGVIIMADDELPETESSTD